MSLLLLPQCSCKDTHAAEAALHASTGCFNSLHCTAHMSGQLRDSSRQVQVQPPMLLYTHMMLDKCAETA